MTRESRLRRRELESELRDLPTPPPPAGLLDAIRREIPAELVPANSTAPAPRPWHRSPLLRLAASLAVVAAGLTIALRVADRPAAQPGPSSGTQVEAPATIDRSGSAAKAEERETSERERGSSAVAAGQNEAARTDVATPSPKVFPISQEAGTPHRGATVDSADAGAGVVSEADKSATLGESVAAIEERKRDLRSRLQELRSVPERPLEAPAAEDAPVLLSPERRAVPVSPAAPSMAIAGGEAGRGSEGGVRRETARPEITDRVESLPVARSKRIAADHFAMPPSTGGTAEPNDAPAGDMFFRPVGTNPFVDTAEDALSTFALDVDTGSWTLARSYLERGALPPAEAIRVEELVNAQRYDDPAPRRGEFTLVAEGAPSPFAPAGDYRLLRFAVKGRELSAFDRKPAILTFVVDVSGSMNRENRLGLVKRALGLLLDELSPEDRVGLVVYGSRGRVVLGTTADHERIRRAVDSLRPEGSTNAEEGLRLGYDLASESFRAGFNNRVILCSDGVANVGATGPESILGRIGREARRGIELTTVGFGMGNYNDALMEQLADQGDGRYHYVDSLDEARRIFVENLTGTLETIARDAKVQVEFDPAAVERWRLIGYENRDVADRDFRNDRVDAGEIGAGHAATALYEVRLAPRARRNAVVGTLRLRWKSVGTGRVEEAALPLRVRDLDRSFAAASGNLRRAAIAAELGEMLKGSYYARGASWQELRAAAHDLRRSFAPGRRPDELVEMVDRSAALAGERPGGPWEDE